MCVPPAVVGLLSMGVGVAQSVAQYSAGNQEAKANEKASVQAWKDQQTQITQREMQEQDALRQKQTQQNLEEAQAKAEVQVSGAASGVSGISLDNLLNDVSRICRSQMSATRGREKTPAMAQASERLARR